MISTWLDGPGEARSPKTETKSSPDKRTYIIKFTVPVDYRPGAAKLMTKIDDDEARKCDVTIARVTTPGGGHQNPFTTITLVGTSKDATGAVLPGVQIEARNMTSGATSSAVASSSGRFELHVTPGTYHVTATLPGFGQQQRDVTIASGFSQTIDFIFKLQK